MVLYGLCTFRKQCHKTFHRQIKNVTNIQKPCIQPFVETNISEPGERQGREKSRRIKYSWNYIGTREKVNLYFLLGRLSFCRFNLAIKILATDVYLGEEKKSFILIFFFCCYGSKLLKNSPFFLNRTNYRRIPCLIEDLNSLQWVFRNSVHWNHAEIFSQVLFLLALF